MMSYQNYNVEDFLADERFQSYCSGTDHEANKYWQKILQEQPYIEPSFLEAVRWYNVLSGAQGNVQEQTDRLMERIDAGMMEVSPGQPVVRTMHKKWWAAAAIVLIIATGGYFFLRKPVSNSQTAKTNGIQPVKEANILPGGDRAILTLADGKTIILDSAANGALTQQGGVKVIKMGGQLTYSNEGNKTEVLYNTITTPNGGQYQLELADGSKVWLNAASSLRFPTAFIGEERIVELTGEGYFEVAHNGKMPFHVRVNDMDVQVLGTHFNINSYSDEPSVRTTLLEGSVLVKSNEKQVLLSPGQQAVLQPGADHIEMESNVNTEEVVAWKNGKFYFENADIQAIMKQLQRWYDVEVSYPNGMVKGHYRGKISRSVRLSQVMKILEEGGLHFRMEGKKIMISP